MSRERRKQFYPHSEGCKNVHSTRCMQGQEAARVGVDLTVSFDAVELPGHGLERQLGLAARWELLGIHPVGQQHDNEEGRKNRERHAPGPTLVRARHHIPLSSTPLLFQGGWQHGALRRAPPLRGSSGKGVPLHIITAFALFIERWNSSVFHGPLAIPSSICVWWVVLLLVI